MPSSLADPSVSIPIVVAILLFAAVALAGVQMNRRETRLKRLSAVIAQPAAASSPTAKDVDKAASVRDTQFEKRLRTAEKERAAAQSKRTLRSRFAEAGWRLTPTGWWIGSVISGVTLAGTIAVLRFSPLVIFLCFIVGTLGLPRLMLAMSANKRRKAFLTDLADAIEAMVRALRAGLPVSEAMGMIGRDFSGPVGAEFLIAVDEQKLGVPLGEALARVGERMPLPEMRMLAMAVTIQMQTGGSLSEALANLANVIRARHRLKRKIKAVSSEARISALIMAALPLFVMGALYLMKPEYLGLLFTESAGKMLVAFCATWMLLGTVVMWRMVNFKM